MTDRHRAEQGSVGSTSSSLLERVKSQDNQAWQRLVDLYGPLVYHWCRGARLRPEDTADVFQEVFRAVAAHVADFRKGPEGGTFCGWLLTITQNKIHDHFCRKQGQAQAAGGSDALRQLAQGPAPVEEQDEALEPGQERGLFHRALEMIRSEFEDATWQAFWQVAVEGRLPADIAAEMGLSLIAVYKAKARVLHRLRKELGDLLG